MAAVIRPTARDTLPPTYPVAIRQAAGNIDPEHTSQSAADANIDIELKRLLQLKQNNASRPKCQ